ncbi:hypothetical protein ACT9SR_13130, partial [Enterococcus faecalis]|uniref:hypothetical protein n=1 Tax=Enterococcus faecalis TaxID=1351 RepID=UPI0040390659
INNSIIEIDEDLYKQLGLISLGEMEHISLGDLEQLIENSEIETEKENNILEDFEETNNMNDIDMAIAKAEEGSSSNPINPNH